MEGIYDWGDRSSELGRKFITSLPLSRMTYQDLRRFREALDELYDMQEELRKLKRLTAQTY